jgi:hypothetical protein
MFENMRHASGILRHGAQAHEEYIVIILSRQMKMPRARGRVFKLIHMQLECLNPLTALEYKGGVMFWNGIHLIVSVH